MHSEMRVVGGTARGRRLVVPGGSGTRPTSDRTREAIFNALGSRGPVEGVTALDLYAGSGAMGIEALSRGAAHVTFVERDARARSAIDENLADLGFLSRASVRSGPVERILTGGGPAAVDLAFCDPPYAFDRWDELLAQLPASLVVMEAAGPVSLPEGWGLVREARYGAAWVGFAEKATAVAQGGDP